MAKTRAYQVFISHSGAKVDTWIANALRAQIESIGCSAVWVDVQQLKLGSIPKEKIIEAIRASDELLVLVSKTSNTSDWVQTEIGMAMGLGRLFVPVLLDVDRNKLPNPIRDHLPVDLPETDKYLGELKARATAEAAD